MECARVIAKLNARSANADPSWSRDARQGNDEIRNTHGTVTAPCCIEVEAANRAGVYGVTLRDAPCCRVNSDRGEHWCDWPEWY